MAILDAHYISTDSATFFVNEWWLDDAAGLQFQVQDPKEPLYGFRDKHWRDIAEGNIIVHGMLDINFRFKGYLTLLLANLEGLEVRLKLDRANRVAGEGTFEDDYHDFRRALNPENNLRQAAIDPRTFTEESRAALLESSAEQFDLRRFRRLAKAMQEDFWRQDVFLFGNRIEQMEAERHRAGTWPDGFNLKIVYQNTHPDDSSKDQDPGLVQTLLNVRIVGESKILQNNVPGGGEPLMERYQFIARDVV